MTDSIFLIDPATRKTTSYERVSYSAIGIHERSDLQRWILENPGILGESLLFITSEFAGFDKSSRRLDILALDQAGTLVVIELKLDVKHELADLQVLRYAAFCSTMTMDQVVQEYGRFHSVTPDDAAQKICDFLEIDEDLPELGDRPRMMIVAGSLENVELTSTVLWLRNFGLDFHCIEVTPYQLGSQGILLVPQIIIPLPEAEEYQVRVAQKEVVKIRKEKEPSPYEGLWGLIREHFSALETPFQISKKPQKTYLQVSTGHGFHYEWQVRRREGVLDVAVHFEKTDSEWNLRLANLLASREEEISSGMKREFRAGPWGKKWASAKFIIPFSNHSSEEDLAVEASEAMAVLMERTWPILEDGLAG